MADLSVLIPARNEQWLSKTIEDVLSNMRGDTEIIAVLDGAWADPPIADHPKVTLIYLSQPIGQRAATNLAARLSTAKYIMKLDAHCAVAEGFDLELIRAAEELGPQTTQIPAQTNLHVYDRVCQSCGKRSYQGPQQNPCDHCGGPCTIEVVWRPRRGTKTTNWTFSPEPKFQYGGTAQGSSDIEDVMSSLGACFFMEREFFHNIGGLDERHGSWGSFGIEIACKTWLSGGRHVVNKRTWFSHFFRVGGIGFPYPISGAEQERARTYSKNIWFRNQWPLQKHQLLWLVDKFWPIKGWTDEDRDRLINMANGADEQPADSDAHNTAVPSAVNVPALPVAKSTAGILYYTDGNLDNTVVGDAVRSQLATIGLPITAVSIKPLGFGDQRIVLPLERGYLTMFKQILAGLEAMDTDIVFFCEHDVLYHPSHFDFVPPDREQYHYNLHVWKVDATSGRAVHYLTKQTSGLCAYRDILIEHYRERVARVERDGFSRRMGFEPGSHRRAERVDDRTSATWMSSGANLDIRHDRNLTQTRWSPTQFRDQRNCQGWTEADEVPGWGLVKGRIEEILTAVGARV